MKATEANLLQFLKKSPQFVIPIYQRNYSWTKAQCVQLWDDIMRAGRNGKANAHFIGSIVYVERGLSTVTAQEALLVIDGQQRLTTTTLLIATLAEYFETNDLQEILDTFSARKLRNYYLVNPEEDGDRHFKLLLSETDKDSLLAILRKAPLPQHGSTRIMENHALFRDLIESHKNELETICQGLAKLVIVDISLDRSNDNPQLIFESMNSTGLELSQADLIRNYILMGLEPKLQTDLYTTYWRPMEVAFGQDAYVTHFDAFMRHYLTVKTGEIPNIKAVYAAFKTFSSTVSGNTDDEKTRHLIADLHTFASYYVRIALGKESNPQLKQAFHDLRELKVDVAYPFLLEAYHDYQNNIIDPNDLLTIVRLVESYVFRRAICSIPTNSLNKTFSGLSRSLKKDRYVESLQATLLLSPSYRRFPTDDEFGAQIKVRDLYNFRSRSYWLRRMENHGRKERVRVDDYTIEHILPQNEHLSEDWRKELGPEWQRVRQDWLHTLGNLTLTGYNSEYSDRPFAYKKSQALDQSGQPVGLASSPLHLNQGLGSVQQWNEEAIKQRAQRLSSMALKVWPAPQLEDQILDAYRANSTDLAQAWSINDHPYLVSGPTSNLFQALRQSILALDPCVSEEFLKLYVAYKAETNFVDIVPQAKRLRLSLNMPFHELDDPKGLCKDVSNLGRWGNGDVEIGFSELNDLPYIMSLIRQSFDRQMSDVQDA